MFCGLVLELRVTQGAAAPPHSPPFIHFPLATLERARRSREGGAQQKRSGGTWVEQTAPHLRSGIFRHMIPTQETLLGFITARLYVVEADLPP